MTAGFNENDRRAYSYERCRWHEDRIKKMEARVLTLEENRREDFKELRTAISDLKAQGSLVRGVMLGLVTAITTAGTVIGILAALGKV